MVRFDFAGFLIFVMVTLITPGPNNYMLFAHGKNYGFSSSVKIMGGIFFGFIVLLYISGYGISQLILSNPTIGLILKIISSGWLIYLAFALSKLNTNIIDASKSKIGFSQAFFMQFVNPKAWIVAISGASAFMPNMGNQHLNVFTFSLTFAILGIPCMIIWIKFGHLISKILKSEKTNKAIGMAIFLLMISCVVMVWL